MEAQELHTGAPTLAHGGPYNGAPPLKNAKRSCSERPGAVKGARRFGAANPGTEHFAHILKESLINPPGRGTLPDGTTFLRAPTIREPNLRIGRWLPRVFGSVSLILEHSAGRRRKSARQAVNARWAKAKAKAGKKEGGGK